MVPSLRWNCLSSSRAELRSLASRFESGSSSRNTTGSRTTARASATRWRSPPDKLARLAIEEASMPNMRAAQSTFLRISSSGHADRAQRKRDVLFDGEMRIERIALEHHGDIARARRQIGDDVAVNHDIARGRALEPGDHAHQRGLAASGWAEQDEKFAFLRGQVDAVDGAHLVEMLGNARASTMAMEWSPLLQSCASVQ